MSSYEESVSHDYTIRAKDTNLPPLRCMHYYCNVYLRRLWLSHVTSFSARFGRSFGFFLVLSRFAAGLGVSPIKNTGPP